MLWAQAGPELGQAAAAASPSGGGLGSGNRTVGEKRGWSPSQRGRAADTPSPRRLAVTAQPVSGSRGKELPERLRTVGDRLAAADGREQTAESGASHNRFAGIGSSIV